MTERIQSRRSKRRIMKELLIGELSAVDRPAQAPALAVLMKRASDADLAALRKMAAADVDKDYPSTVNQQVQAVDFDTVLAETEAREAAREVTNELREKWYALQRSFDTIACDESVSATDKITAMQASMAQYISSLSEQSDEIAESMSKAFTAVPAVAELLAKNGNTEGDEPMTDAEKKQLAELTKTVDDLKKQLLAATDKEPAKKAADLQKQLDEATAKATELTEKAAKAEAEVVKAEAEKADAVALAKMSDAEKSAMDKMDDKAKAEWMKLSPEERKKKMSKAVDEDPVVYKAGDGTEFRKSDDARLVSMAKRADDLEKKNAEEIEKRENAEFSKAAESEPFTFYKGETADKVKVLRAISKIADEDARKALTDMLEVGGKAIGAAFKSLGHQDDKARKSAADFDKRVTEIASRDKISKSKAMSKARAEFPDEFAAYQAVTAPAN